MNIGVTIALNGVLSIAFTNLYLAVKHTLIKVSVEVENINTLIAYFTIILMPVIC